MTTNEQTAGDIPASRETRIMHRLVAEYGGHSVTIVRGEQRLIGWNGIAIVDLISIVENTKEAPKYRQFRRIKKSMKEFPEPEWQKGYEFRGILATGSEGSIVEEVDAEGSWVRNHAADSVVMLGGQDEPR